MEKRAHVGKEMKRTAAIILIITASLSCNRLDPLLAQGAINLQLGDYARARVAYGTAVDQYPASGPARLGLGKALLQEFYAHPSDSGILVNSLTQLEAARTLHPDTAVEKLLAVAWFKRADGLLSNHDTIAALQALSRSISLDPASVRPVNLAGILYFQQGEHDKALKLFQKVVAIDTAAVSGYFNAGMVHWADRNFTLAYDCFFKAAQRSPGDREILLWAARAKQSAAAGAP
jgi:tetratricopeptide (TPR) repeat protein